MSGLYDGDQAVLIQYTDGSVIGVASFGANGLLSSRNPNNGVSSFYTFDALGNTCQSLTSAGTPNYTHLVSAFGFSRSSGQDLYDGMGAQLGYRDENTGFIYLLGHRFYDAQFGQFMTRDPMGYRGGVNLYGYTGNNPVNESDAEGLKAGDHYPTKDKAGKDAVRDINPTSIRKHQEFAGVIYRNPDGSYSYTQANPGSGAGSNIGVCPPGKTMAGDYHTHGGYDPGYDNENFSRADKDSNDLEGKPGYLGTPNGYIKKYTPVPGKLRGGPVTVIGKGAK